VIDGEGRGKAFLVALGGAKNLTTVDACTTRLRLIVQSASAIDEPKLRALGAKGLVRPSPNALQVVIGPIADQIAGEIRSAMAEAAPRPAAIAGGVLAALGGAANVSQLTLCGSRIIADLQSLALTDEGALRAAGVRGVARAGGSLQLIVGPQAGDLLATLQAERAQSR
jgi:PTS system N-acetylglucosamine-specific IIC component